MRPVIKSKKHIVQISQGTVAQAAIEDIALVTAQEATSTTPTAVEEGAIVKAIYIELWLGMASATVIGSYTVALFKDPGGSNPASTSEMAALHDYTNKKNILFTSQALLSPTDGGLSVIMRGFYKIPKGKQRFGLNDRMRLVVRNNTASAIDINFCGLAIYKEYT